MEAGGHIGKLTTMTLVRQVAAAVSIPVIAAGGIADGEGVAAGFMLGAEAVQVGTRFVVAKESNAHPKYKEKILKARDIDTTISAQHFGHAVRAIKNQLTRDFEQAEKDAFKQEDPDLEIFEQMGAGALAKAVVHGDVEGGSVMAGQIAGLVSKEETVEEILKDLYYGAAKKIQEEETNNFYVALTRPKNNLVILYNDRLFEEKPLEDSNLKDFFSCEIGEIHRNIEIIEVETPKKTSYNSSSYFLNSNIENEEIIDNFEVNNSKFLLETEEKRMIGILVHYFFENLKYGSEEEVAFAKNLCYKKYLSYFGKKKLDEIFSKENIEMFLNKDKEIFSKKWNYIYNEYVLYDAIEKQEYRIDRLMIKDNDDGTGEIYIVDYKTGGKNENQLKTYASVLKKTFKELKNYEIKTNFLEFDVF